MSARPAGLAINRYPRLLLKTRVPWEGRAEDKTDDSVWAVTCFVTRAGFRRHGVTYALARAAVDFARERGARAIEGYPMITHPGLLQVPSRRCEIALEPGDDQPGLR